MSEALLKNTFNKISPAYELVADVTVGTTTNQVDFSGLNFGKDDDLMLVSDFQNGSTVSTPSYFLFANANYTQTNYYNQYIYANGTSVTSARQNSAYYAYVGLPTTTKPSLVISKIKLTNNGYIVSQDSSIQYYASSSVALIDLVRTSTFTATSITSFRISTDITNGIGIGSRFQLYRLKAKKVADIIVSTATTQVDIPDLVIDKDSEYMLVSELSANSVATTLYLYANGNTTDTNYYVQRILAGSTTVQAVRYNATIFMNSQGGTEKDFAITNIKLTNNGYFVYQSNHNFRNSNPTNLELRKWYTTSTFTMTSITSLRITSSATNGIGIGSRFTLYKMR